MAEMADAELMLMFQRGDSHAFQLLFEKHRVSVFNFLYRMLGNQREPAEDLLQEVFLKVSKGRHLYRPGAKFSSWLFTIARNHCLNHIRSRQYLQAQDSLPLDEPRAEGSTSLGDQLAARERTREDVERGELRRLLEACILELPEEYREVFLLRAVEGLDYSGIAGILGTKEPTVRTKYRRARLMLKERLGRLLQGGQP